MTVLERYQRLESLGLWRASATAQRREVVVSIGEATLLLTELNGRIVTQWSLPAMSRLNPGKRPAEFGLEGVAGETLEIADDDMLDALEAVMAALSGGRLRPARLRAGALLTAMAALILALAVWLPGAISSYIAKVAPMPVRADIASLAFEEVQRLTGPACDAKSGAVALRQLEARLFPGGEATLSVMPSAVMDVRALPGGRLVIGRGLVEDHETPAVLAASIIAETIRHEDGGRLRDVLSAFGLRAALRLLTTGEIDPNSVADWAAARLVAPQATVPDDTLIEALSAAGVPSAPYAYAVDITGDTTQPLIEASTRIETQPLLSDGHWLALQRICEDRG